MIFLYNRIVSVQFVNVRVHFVSGREVLSAVPTSVLLAAWEMDVLNMLPDTIQPH